jgi:hypothetical protein
MNFVGELSRKARFLSLASRLEEMGKMLDGLIASLKKES